MEGTFSGLLQCFWTIILLILSSVCLIWSQMLLQTVNIFCVNLIQQWIKFRTQSHYKTSNGLQVKTEYHGVIETVLSSVIQSWSLFCKWLTGKSSYSVCLPFLYVTKINPLKKHEKCFLFQLKCCFRYQDIQIFIIFVFPVHCFNFNLVLGKGVGYSLSLVTVTKYLRNGERFELTSQ